jgi:DNA-binding CsgD family transcriptional regulator
MLRMVCEGYDYTEIGETLGLTAKKVTAPVMAYSVG